MIKEAVSKNTKNNSQSRTQANPQIAPKLRDATTNLLALQHALGNQTVNHFLSKNLNRIPDHPERQPVTGKDSPASIDQPLEADVRRKMEEKFQQDFSSVRIHTDPNVARIVREKGARAFTIGNDVFFGAGEYHPESTEGRQLLGHELTHVVQQQNNIKGQGPALNSAAAEKAADRTSSAISDGQHKVVVPGFTQVYLACKDAAAAAPTETREPFSLRQSLDPSFLSYNELIGEMNLIRKWLASNPVTPEENSLREALQRFERELADRRKPQPAPKPGEGGGNPEQTLIRVTQDIEKATTLPDDPSSYSLRVNGQWRVVPASELKRIQDGVRQALMNGINKVEMRVSGGREGHKHQANVRSEFPIVSRISDVFGGVSFPPLSIWDEPSRLAAYARMALTGGEVLGMKIKSNQYQESAKALIKAERLAIKADRDFHKYWIGTIAGAESAQKTLEFTRDAAFTVNAVLATVATGGAAATAIVTLAPAAAELGQQAMEVHLGMRDRIDWGSITVNVLTGLIVGKLAGPIGKKILGPLTARFGAIGGRMVTNLLVGQYSGAFQTLLNTTYEAVRGKNITFEEFLKLVGDRLTDPKEALANILMGELEHRVQTRSKAKTVSEPLLKEPPKITAPAKTTQPVKESPQVPPVQKPPVESQALKSGSPKPSANAPAQLEIIGEPVRVPPRPKPLITSPKEPAVAQKPSRGKSNLVDQFGRPINKPSRQKAPQLFGPNEQPIKPRRSRKTAATKTVASKPPKILGPNRPTKPKSVEIVKPGQPAAPVIEKPGAPLLVDPTQTPVLPGGRVSLKEPLALKEPLPPGATERGKVAEPLILKQRFPDATPLPPGHEGFDAVQGGSRKRVFGGRKRGPLEVGQRIEGGRGISVKHIDVKASSYQTGEGFYNGMKKYVDAAYKYPRSKPTLRGPQGPVTFVNPEERLLHLELSGIPSEAQLAGISKLRAYAADHGIQLQVTTGQTNI